MQSPVCRKGPKTPIIKEESNTCTLHISNLGVKDSGNYLTNYDRGAPTFKAYLVVSQILFRVGPIVLLAISNTLIIYKFLKIVKR